MSTPAPKEIYNKYVYITAVVASMGAFIFGYDLAFIGTTITLTPFKRDFGLLDASQSTADSFSANIVSLLQAGCFFGSLAVAPLGDKYGRKPALIIAGAAFCIGSLIQTLSYGLIEAMFVGRAIGGLVSRSILRVFRSRASTNNLIGSWTCIWDCTVVYCRTRASGYQVYTHARVSFWTAQLTSPVVRLGLSFWNFCTAT